MYVIWYRKIWQVATGDTRAYSGCCDPAAQHTNHVHMSMY
jgi:peptidoglycan DL-endopeptidase CwlO